MDRDSRYWEARNWVVALKIFYIHLIAYVVVNFGLIVLNLTTSPKQLWFFFPLFGWGIGILAHALAVFGLGGFLGRSWEDKKIQQYLERKK
ncbi:MAG: 2TM domain-containing protein [candidate division FCPU426 bacterium]